MTDEELQNSVVNGNGGESRDHKAYRLVFNALKKEPSYQLPAGFSLKVIRQIKATPASTAKEMAWLYAGLISLIIAAIVSVFLTEFNFSTGIFNFISSYPGLIIFGVLFIMGLQVLDKKFVRKTF